MYRIHRHCWVQLFLRNGIQQFIKRPPSAPLLQNKPEPTLFGNRFSQQDLPTIKTVINLGLDICKIKAVILSTGRIKSNSTHENPVTVILWHPIHCILCHYTECSGENVSRVVESQLANGKNGEGENCPLQLHAAIVYFLCLSPSIKNFSYPEVSKPVTNSSKITVKSSVKT